MKRAIFLMAVAVTVVQVAKARENSPPGMEIAKMAATPVLADAIIPAIDGIEIDAAHNLNGALTITRDHAIAPVATALDVPFAPLIKQIKNPGLNQIESKRPQKIPRE